MVDGDGAHDESVSGDLAGAARRIIVVGAGLAGTGLPVDLMPVEDGWSVPGSLREQGRRLLLREPTRADGERLFACASDPEVTRFLAFDPPRAPSDTLEFIDRVEAWSRLASDLDHGKLADITHEIGMDQPFVPPGLTSDAGASSLPSSTARSQRARSPAVMASPPAANSQPAPSLGAGRGGPSA